MFLCEPKVLISYDVGQHGSKESCYSNARWYVFPNSVIGCSKIVPANQNLSLNSIIGAAFGAAGQRCMAISVGKGISPYKLRS